MSTTSRSHLFVTLLASVVTLLALPGTTDAEDMSCTVCVTQADCGYEAATTICQMNCGGTGGECAYGGSCGWDFDDRDETLWCF